MESITLLRYAVIAAPVLLAIVLFAVGMSRYTKPVGYDDDQPFPYPQLGNYGPDNEGLPDISTGYHMFADGNAWCAVGPTYIDLVQSNAGFGYTHREAYDDWWRCNVKDNRAAWAGRPVPTVFDFHVHLPTVAPNGR